jgi:hypothetical protein
MAGSHTRLSPSSAHRWARCAGAPNAEYGLSDKAGKDAAHGTCFHDVAATCLDFGLEPEDFAGTEVEADGYTFMVDDDMVRYMRPGLDWVRERAVGAKLFVETRVDLSPLLGPGEGGTADVGIVSVARKRIIVFDWKYGAGIPVSPVENEQLSLYGLGFWHTIAAPLFNNDPTGVTVELVIEQPRAPGGGGVWLTTMEALLEWGAGMAVLAEATHDPDAPRVAGETQCTFCKARRSPAGCDAYNQMAADLIGLTFDDMDSGAVPSLPRPADLTPERRSYIVLHADLIAKWLKDVHAQVLGDALKGEPTPGVKVVSGRRTRKWGDAEGEIAKILVAELGETGAYVREMISPAVAQKELTSEAYECVSRYVAWTDGKPALVPEDDKRAALQSYADKFGDEDLL